MDFVELTNRVQLRKAYQLLIESMPREELISWEELYGPVEEGQTKVFVLQKPTDRTYAGVMVIDNFPHAELVLLSYLAVDPRTRGKGIGGELFDAVLEWVRKNWKPSLILGEVELPDTEMLNENYGDPALRHKFYARRGAELLDINYYAPALYENGPRLDFNLIVWVENPEWRKGDVLIKNTIMGMIENYNDWGSKQPPLHGKDEQWDKLYAEIMNPNGIRILQLNMLS